MRSRLGFMAWAMILVLFVSAGATSAFAQTGSATLSGVVVDAQGGVIPGADVAVKNNATAATVTGVSDAEGRFTFPSMTPGTYTVTVSLMGFKTFVAPDVQVVTATPASVKATLQVGGKEETIVVTGAADVIQTQSAAVSTTIDVKQIQKLPVITHTALDYVVNVAGVETVGSNTRGSTINGLPTSAINITLDGINVQDKRGTEGFFMYIRPMMDSVEEITVTTSTPSADASGSGSANITMTTRSGTNRFSASAYNSWRNQAGTNDDDAIARAKHPGWLWRLNTPYWFNKRDLPKTAAGDYFINDTRLQTPGFRLGGPIFKDKLFYFGNYEEFRLPESRSRTRFLLNQQAQLGNFTYVRADNGQLQTVNLLTLAASKGQTATVDPTIAKLLADIRSSTSSTGAVRAFDSNVDQYDYVPSATQLRKFPTVKLDYNVTQNQRLSATYRYNDFNSNPDFLNSAEARWPGFPNQGSQVSGRYQWQGNLHSIFGKVVNEIRIGIQDATGDGSYFGKGVDSSQFNCAVAGCQSAGGRGFNLTFPAANAVSTSALTGATAYNTPSASIANQRSIEDTVTYIRGNHSFSGGVAFNRTQLRATASTPNDATLAFGVGSTDPAFAMLDSSTAGANFPGGINTTYSTYAKNLYGLLTGRVTGITSTYYLQADGTYKAQAVRTNASTADDLGFFVSDTWRVKPNLTATLGLRYEFQLPMTTDGLYSRPESWEMVYGVTGAGDGLFGSGNLYKPGTLTGSNPVLVQYEKNRQPYKLDKNNVAPSIGLAWRPTVNNKLISMVTGKDPVFRGGYSISYVKLGTGFFDSNYAGNPGRSRSGSRSVTTGTPFITAPLLLRNTDQITPSAAPAALTGAWRITPAVNESIDVHYPVYNTPHTHQYSVGIQRQIGRDLGIDVRYVGNTSVGSTNRQSWVSWDMNAIAQRSMRAGENGFIDEFRKAQANLRANIIAGRGNTFAYTGAPGTAPLPIFQAYFAGIPLADARNQQTSTYTSANYSNSTWYNSLNMYAPSLGNISGTGTSGLSNAIGTNTGLDANRIKAGLPINFFFANPALAQGNAFLETEAGNGRYNSIQVDVTKRLARGLQVQTNYVWSFLRKDNLQRSLREDWFYVPSTQGTDHTFKATATYELPFGKNQKFGSDAGRVMNAVIGGWELDGSTRLQTGQKFNVGGFRLVGMDEKELQKIFKVYHETDSQGVERIYMFPQDVIQQSIIALNNSSATSATGYAGALPTGRYFAPASGPDCVQYLAGDCPGTSLSRILTGPKYFRADMSIVKRIDLVKRAKLEARMDIFNLFDTINFTPNTTMGSSVTAWQVTAAAQDVNASQDPGGRITQFGLRITW